MNIKVAFTLILIVAGLLVCSEAPAQADEPFPKPGKHYMYVGDTLVASFDYAPSADLPYHPELFAGNVTHQHDGKFERYTLTGGSVIFRSNKDKSEVARLTAERIVWYGPLE